MDWLRSIFGFSPTTSTRTTSLDARVQDQAFENAVATTTMTTNNKNNKHACILPHHHTCTAASCRGPRSKCFPDEGDVPNAPATSDHGIPPPVFNPSQRSPPNSPARPIGPAEEWYLGKASGGNGDGVVNGQEENQDGHPHPLRSHPTHSLDHDGDGEGDGGEISPVNDKEELLRFGTREGGGSKADAKARRGGGEDGGGDRGADAEGEASFGSAADGEVGAKPRPQGQTARAARKAGTKLEEGNEARPGEGEWNKGASGLGPGEGWYA